MLKEALQWLADHGKFQTIEVNGFTYAREKIVPVLPPRVSSISMQTLTGVKDYIEKDPDNLLLTADNSGHSPLHIQVKSHEMVFIEGPIIPLTSGRTLYVISDCSDILQGGFRYNKYLSVETFIIAVSTCFAESEARGNLIKMVGNVRSDNGIALSDDGVSQTVDIRSGVSCVEKADIEPFFELAPYRTFPEVEQPTSKFLLRLKKGENGTPECALFEVNDSAWKLEAIQNIKAWLETNIDSDRHVSILA